MTLAFAILVQVIQLSVLHSRMMMNCDTIRINWEWLMMLIVHLFCNSSISESIYICMLLPFEKMAISGEKTTFQIFCSRKSYRYDIIIL